MTTATIQASPDAAVSDVLASAEDMCQLVSFRLADEEYCVDIMHVQEVILSGLVTEMPQVPGYVCGLINLRGNVIPIMDLRKRFSLEAAQANEETRVVVLNVGDRTVGVVVDAVNEVLRLNRQQIESAPSGVFGAAHDYVTGLVKFHDKILIMLNMEEIVTQEMA